MHADMSIFLRRATRTRTGAQHPFLRGATAASPRHPMTTPAPSGDAFAASGSSPGAPTPAPAPAPAPTCTPTTPPTPHDPDHPTGPARRTPDPRPHRPGPATRAVRGGRRPSPEASALLPGICQSTTFAQRGVGDHDGFTYSRCDNPTVVALERALADLEGVPADHALAYASGMAALTGLVAASSATGARVVCSRTVYGGTVRLLRELLGRFGVDASFVDTTDLGPGCALERALADPDAAPARLVLIETPANPTLELTDVAAAARLAHAHGALLAVDNTFLTAVQQPVLPLGADIAVLSTTKYVEGHNATTGGALLVADRDAGHGDRGGRDRGGRDRGSRDLVARLRYERTILGSIQKPFEAWLTLQGLKTLPLRLAQHGRNALAVARALEAHPLVGRVRHPFLDSFEQVELARRQQSGGGGMVAFELDAGRLEDADARRDAVRRFFASTRLCTLAENLGATESLITHPATMTHASYTADERERLGITDGLVRVSVGLEDPEDVVRDLVRAIELAVWSTLEDRASAVNGNAVAEEVQP